MRLWLAEGSAGLPGPAMAPSAPAVGPEAGRAFPAAAGVAAGLGVLITTPCIQAAVEI